jgi:hypothetical protein
LVCRKLINDDELLAAEMNRQGLACTTTTKLFGQVKNELVEFARKHPLVDMSKHRAAQDDESDDSSSDSSDSSDSSASTEETDEEAMAGMGVFDAEGRLIADPGPLRATAEEWEQLLKKYAKPPTNTLEREREAYFTTRHSGKTLHVSDCRSEADLIMFQRQR